MYLIQCAKATTLAFTLLLTGAAVSVQAHAQSAEEKHKTDNTAVNKRDRNSSEATADQQKMNATDRKAAAKIRKAVMADKSMSTYAQNVKIICQDGTVTLKGPVRTDEEAAAIVAKATTAMGASGKVINEMTVEPVSKP